MQTDDVGGHPTFGSLVGQPAFEQARGVVMYWCGGNAETALVRMTEVVLRACGSPECLVAGLRTCSEHVLLRTLFDPIRTRASGLPEGQ